MARVTRAKHVAHVGNINHSHYDVKGVLGRSALLFAMRLHASILGSSAMAPVVGLAYQPKVDFYFNSLGLGEYSLGFDAFTPDGLTAHLRRGWEHRAEIGQRLQQRIPELQHEARKAAELVACIRRGEDVDEAFTRIAAT